MNKTTMETIIQMLRERQIEPDATYTAASGHDWGYVAAYQMPKGDYLVQYGDNGQTDYDIAEDVDDLACWLLPGGDDNCDGSEDAKIIVASVRGIDHIQAATPDTDGPFRVLHTSYYYGSTERTDWLRDDTSRQDAVEYETYTDAEAAISEAEDGIYTLSHNESGRPSYKIVSV